MKDFDLDEELGEELAEELAEDANRLIFIKKSIAEFQEEEKAIKKKLEPQIGLAKPLLIPDGIIYFCSKKTAKSFNRTEVLEFIEELCGPEIAHALDMECTKKKYIDQRLHVKTWENKK